MTALVIAFPIVPIPRPVQAIDRPVLTQAWTEQHLPLIDAAMDLDPRGDGAASGRSNMSAAIIQFPAGASRDALAAPHSPIAPAGLSTKFADHFLPVVQASVDLLSADEADFEARCRRMLDSDGTAMIDELCAEMQIVGRQMRLLADGLDLTRARLRTAIARVVPDVAVGSKQEWVV